MAIFDVIGVYQNGKITSPPFNPKSLIPFEQPIDGVVQGEDLVIRMYCQNNDGSGLDITNWSFECTVLLAQAPNPAQAAPPPPMAISRAGIIVAPNPAPTLNTPLGGVVTFVFSGIAETAFWFPWETDSYDIYANAPGAPPSQRENFVPPSGLQILQSTTVFPVSPTPTPTPPTPYTYLFSVPAAQIPDPRTYPLSTIIKTTDTGQVLWNAGTAWIVLNTPTVPAPPHNKKNLSEGVLAPLFSVNFASITDLVAAVAIRYSVESTDGINAQVQSGTLNGNVVRTSGGAWTTNQTPTGTTNTTTQGNITVAFSWTTSGNVATLNVTVTSTPFTPTILNIVYDIELATHPEALTIIP